MDILKRVTDVIVENLGIEAGAVTPEATFSEDLGADSLEIVNLIMGFEDEFEITIPDEDVADKIKTVNDVVTYLKGKLDT